MEKKAYQYKLNLRCLEDNRGQTMNLDSLELAFSSHDNIFAIIEMQKAKQLFADEQELIRFALGLKLFGEVMIKHREDALFKELTPVFVEFMKKVKSQ